jgi:hypothetical protein
MSLFKYKANETIDEDVLSGKTEFFRNLVQQQKYPVY